VALPMHVSWIPARHWRLNVHHVTSGRGIAVTRVGDVVRADAAAPDAQSESGWNEMTRLARACARCAWRGCDLTCGWCRGEANSPRMHLCAPGLHSAVPLLSATPRLASSPLGCSHTHPLSRSIVERLRGLSPPSSTLWLDPSPSAISVTD
jgi:hypothetical protein